MNISLISLSFSFIKSHTLLTFPPKLQRDRLEISKCSFVKIFKNVLNINSQTHSLIHQTTFKKSLDSILCVNSIRAITKNSINDLFYYTNFNFIDSQKVPHKFDEHIESETYSNKTILFYSESLTFTNCYFELCFSIHKPAVLCIDRTASKKTNLVFSNCRFVFCSSIYDTAILKNYGESTVFKKTCISYCRSFSSGQTIKSDCKTSFVCLNHFYCTSPKKKSGICDLVSLSKGRGIFEENNVTQCHVVELRCLGDFYNLKYVKYKHNTNINCSGRSYLGFDYQSNESEISDSILYKCVPYANYNLCMFEINGKVTIRNFYFFKTKMLFTCCGRDSFSDTTHLTLIDCVTDSSKPNLAENKYELINISYNIVMKSEFRQDTNFSEWRCVTPYIPTPAPVQTPIATQSPINNIWKPPNNEKLEKELSKSSDDFMLFDVIQILFLMILSIITVVIFVLTRKKEKNREREMRNSEEHMLLIKH